MALTLVPIFQKQAKQFVGRHHRHNMPSIASVFNIGCAEDEVVIGVAMVGLPKARLLMDGRTLEVTRVCVREHVGACARAAAALGWRRLVTYTLPTESGSSLKAAGWRRDDAYVGGDSWEQHTLHPGRGSHDMFGNERIPQGPKVRWWKVLPTWP